MKGRNWFSANVGGMCCILHMKVSNKNTCTCMHVPIIANSA